MGDYSLEGVFMMRIGGIASGIDTQSLVRDMMRVERMPVDKMKQKQQTLEWQRDDYREINTLLLDFSKKINEMKYPSKYQGRQVSSSNESLVTATANSGASHVAYSISKVDQLATAAQKISGSEIGGTLANGKLDVNKALSRDTEGTTWQKGTVATKSFEGKNATDGGKALQLNLDGAALQNVARDMSVKVNGKSYEVVTDIGDGLKANQVLVGSDGKLTFKNALAADDVIKVDYATDKNADTSRYMSFKIDNGSSHETFLVKENETFKSVMDRVNRSDAGVSMLYDEFSDKVSLTSKETGEADINVLGQFMESFLDLGSTGVNHEGKNAKFTINGLETERASNTFTMDGVSFTLNRESVGNESSQIIVNSDSKNTFDNIVGFVEEYNKIIDAMQGKISEDRNRNYKPLTDDEKEQLSDKEIEKWEDIAKTGLLQRDPILTRALSDMRVSSYSKVDNPALGGAMSMLSQIGIATTADYRDGKLVIDEDKLRAAIDKDPEAVEKLFIGNGDSHAEKGIIHRLSDNVTNTRDQLRVKAGSATMTNQNFAIGKQLQNLESQIERFEARLLKTEDRYWAQFSAMERAMQRANEQSAALMQLLGGM